MGAAGCCPLQGCTLNRSFFAKGYSLWMHTNYNHIKKRNVRRPVECLPTLISISGCCVETFYPNARGCDAENGGFPEESQSLNHNNLTQIVNTRCKQYGWSQRHCLGHCSAKRILMISEAEGWIEEERREAEPSETATSSKRGWAAPRPERENRTQVFWIARKKKIIRLYIRF